MSLRLEFTPLQEGPLRGGFARGHMTVAGDRATTTSADRTPDQSMMLVLSVTELLDGVRRFLSDTRSDRYEFIATDSSFGLVFERGGDGISVRSGPQVLAIVDADTLARALRTAASRFLAGPAAELAEDDAAGLRLARGGRRLRAHRAGGLTHTRPVGLAAS